MRNKPWIIGFGDSFTYGDELPDQDLARGDHHFDKILKKARREYPEMKADTFMARRQWIVQHRNHDYSQLCNDYSYLNKACVAAKIGLRNFAKPGQSIDHILCAIIEYFEYNNPPQLEVAVVGTGVGFRHTVWWESEEKFKSQNWWHNIRLAEMSEEHQDITDELIREFLEPSYNNFLFESSCNHIRRLFDRFEVPLIMFDAKARLDDITDHYRIERCAFGHPGPEAHDILAIEIQEKIEKTIDENF